MPSTWSKDQIYALKRRAYPWLQDPAIGEQLTKLNLHLSNYDKAPLIHAKNAEWKEVERIATEMNEMLAAAARRDTPVSPE